MKFLAKLASIVMTAIKVESGLTPYLTAKVNGTIATVESKATDFITLATGILSDIQVAGIGAGLTNEQKLAAAVPLIAKELRATETFLGHEIPADKLDAFNAAVKGITSNLVDALNTLKTDNIKTS
jgi:hypothetical protein